MRALPWTLLCLAAALGAGSPTLPAADSAEALRQKDAEVRELRRRLEQAEKELEQLRRDNERLRRQQEQEKAARPEASTPAAEARRADEAELRRLREENERLRRARARDPRVAPAAREAKPVRPLSELPPLTPDTVVDVQELVAHFQADPAGAAARYAKKTFRVRGEVDRFHTALVQRRFTVLLTDPNREATVACRFNYVDRYKTVFTTQNGRVLTARYDSGREVPLLETGQTAVIAGRCDGVDKHGMIGFSRCEWVR
jgi:hypothetical protein